MFCARREVAGIKGLHLHITAADVAVVVWVTGVVVAIEVTAVNATSLRILTVGMAAVEELAMATDSVMIPIMEAWLRILIKIHSAAIKAVVVLVVAAAVATMVMVDLKCTTNMEVEETLDTKIHISSKF